MRPSARENAWRINIIWLLPLALVILGEDVGRGAADEGVYLVMLKQQPVMAYRGTIPGLTATRVKPGYKLNVNAADVVAYQRHLLEKHDTIFSSACGSDTNRKIASVTNTLNAFSASLTQQQVEEIRRDPDVESVVRAPLLRTQMTHTPVLLNLPSTLWRTRHGRSSQGEGIVIGVVDSGIYPEHPSFNDSRYAPLQGWKGKCTVTKDFKCNNKIVSAAYFNKGILAEDSTIVRSADFDSPRARNGHGTHVAAIAAGNSGVQVTYQGVDFGTMSGVASRARLAIYKAMWAYQGDTVNGGGGQAVGSIVDIIMAVERAVSEGCDVINFSNGFDQPKGVDTFLAPLEIQFLVASRAGVLVAVSAGNSRIAGASNADGGTIPFVAPWYLSVASGSTARIFLKTLTVTFRNRTLSLPGTSTTAAVNRARLIRVEDAFDLTAPYTSEFCDDGIDPKLVTGRVVICHFQSGRYSNSAVPGYMKGNGAIGLVFITERTGSGVTHSPLVDSANFALPVIFLDVESSTRLNGFINSLLASSAALSDCSGSAGALPFNCEANTGTFSFFSSISRTTFALNKTAPSVSYFSSNGPDIGTPDVLKPDVLAPGETILSAWTPQSLESPGLFQFLSGTSMASPHVAGILAIMRQRFPMWSPAAIYSAIRTTATTLNNKNKPIISQETGKAADNFDFGYGYVNPTQMANPGLIYDVTMADYARFFCSLGLNSNTLYDVTGIICSSKTSRPSDLNLPAITVGNLSFKRTITRTVRNIGRRSTYVAVVKAPPLFTVTVSPTKLVLGRGRNATFQVTITPHEASADFSSGSLTWVDNKGHSVVSPIIVRARTLIGQPFG